MDPRWARILGMLALACLLAPGSGRAAGEVAPAPSGKEIAALDPARLGMSEGDLVKLFGAALKPQKIEPSFEVSRGFEIRPGPAMGKGDGKQAAPKATAVKADPWEGQKAFFRAVGQGDIVYAEYFFYRGKLYRIRWTLADRFKRPIMAELVALGTRRYGEPVYDQDIVWRPGDPRANLRRAAWERDGTALEIRMLNPTTGGLAYLTVSDLKALRAIVAAGGMAAPEPETAGSWWYGPRTKPSVVTPEEKQALIEAAGALLSRSGF